MKKLFTLLALLTSVFVLKPEEVKASHATGADLTYQYVGPNQILLTLRFYRDCAGIPAPGSVFIDIISQNCGQQFSVNLPQLPGTGQEIPIPNCIDSGLTTCSGGSLYGVQEYVYQAVVTLPAACDDWLFEFQECCRNQAITTIQNASGESIYVSTTLDNLNYSTNSSPVFTSLPVTQFCVGNTFYYDQGATDADGDSLVFSLVDAQGAGGGAVTYNPLLTGATPISSSTGIQIDPLTGLITFTPNQVQVAVICVLVREYRNGVLIGSVKRDIQINITAVCLVIRPAYNVGVKANGIPANCGDNTVIIPYDTVFQCGSALITDFRTLSPFGIPNPVIAMSPIGCTNGVSDSLQITFLNPLTHGTTYIWTKLGNDNNTLLSVCGTNQPEFDTLRIIVVDPSIWVPATDTVDCAFNEFSIELNEDIYCFSVANNGTDLQIVDATGTVFPVANAYGYCNPGGLTSNELLVEMQNTVAGVAPLYLILTGSGTDGNTIANNCGRFLNPGDTIAILDIDPNFPLTLGPDLGICSSDPPVTLDCGFSGLTYQWYDATGAIAGATNQTYLTNTPGTYSVIANNGPGCSGTDTVVVSVTPGPQDQIGSDQVICSYDPYPVFDAGNAGATGYQWALDGTTIPGATASTYPSNAPGTYTVQITTGNGCAGTFDVVLNVNNPPNVVVNDTLICTDGQAILDAGLGDAYVWSTGATTQTITTNTAGVYNVTVSLLGCDGSDGATIVVNDYPVAPVVDCITSTSGAYRYIYTWNAIAGATGYEVSEDGGSTWIPSNAATAPESHGVNISIPAFLVRALGVDPCRIGDLSEPIACEVVIPNIITPNGDGSNEFFLIQNIGQYPNNTLQVFNRWGKEVYTADGYDNTNKKFDGKDLPDGVYFYILNLNSNDQEPKSGTITIIREKKNN